MGEAKGERKGRLYGKGRWKIEVQFDRSLETLLNYSLIFFLFISYIFYSTTSSLLFSESHRTVFSHVKDLAHLFVITHPHSHHPKGG